MANQLPKPQVPEAKATRAVPKRSGRASRRPVEDRPSASYLNKMKSLGPRPGESKLAFEKRLASVAAGRRMIIDTWLTQKGDKARVSLELGIQRSTLSYELRRVGLSTDLLDGMFRGNVIES